MKKPYWLLVFLLIFGSILWGMFFDLPFVKAFQGQMVASVFKIMGIGTVKFQGNSIAGVLIKESPLVTTLVTPIPTPRVTNMSPIKTPSPTPRKFVSPLLSPILSPTPAIIPIQTIKPSSSPVLTPTFSPTPQPTPSPLMSPTPSPSFILTPTPTPSSTTEPSSPAVMVIINEIAWMGTAMSVSDEWIELYNISESPVDLSGWTLKSLTGSNPDPIIILSGIIQPLGYFLLERTNDSTISDISADQIYTGALSDGGEILELRDSAGNLQDKASNAGGWYAGDKTSRSSMERINSKQSGDSAANWKTNDGATKNGRNAENGSINGTPKAKNSAAI